MTSEDLEERLINFASRIIAVAEALPKMPASTHLSRQLFRSGTSPALNYGEARGAESKADFIHKKKVCLKELRETYVCLRIIDKKSWFKKGRLDLILGENNELISIFVSSIKTAEYNKKMEKENRSKRKKH